MYTSLSPVNETRAPRTLSDTDNPQNIMRFSVINQPVELTIRTRGKGKYALSRIGEICGNSMWTDPVMDCEGKPVTFKSTEITKRLKVVEVGDYLLMFEGEKGCGEQCMCDYPVVSMRELGVQFL